MSLALLGLALAGLVAVVLRGSREPQSPAQRHFAAGIRLEAAGETGKALREWQIAAALNPRLPGVHLALGRAYLAQGAGFLAVRELETAAQQAPTTPPHLWCLLAEAYRRIDQRHRAHEAARFAAGAEPKCPRAHRAYGAVLFDRREYPQATRELTTAAALDAADAESRAMLARTALALQDPVGAERRAREAYRIDPASPSAAALLAHVLLEQDRSDHHQEARKLLETAAAAFPNDPNIRADLGRIHLRQGQLTQARAELERAVRLDPRHRLGVAELAKLYAALGREQQAAEHRGLSRELAAADRRRDELESLLRQRPDDGAVLFELADLLARDQQFSRALALMQRAAELRPEDPQIHRQLRDIQDAARRAALPAGAPS